MRRGYRSDSGSVIVVAVAMLLLLSLLAVTYVTVMQVEVQSNEAYQYSAKCDMVIQWYLNDAAALYQQSVRNTGLYEKEDRRGNLRTHSVKTGFSRDRIGAYAPEGYNKPHPQTCINPPHNYFVTPIFPYWKQLNFDTMSSEHFVREWTCDVGWHSSGGDMFGKDESDIDLVNWDGDNDPITHRNSWWRTYRNPDPGIPGDEIQDTWDNIYARAAGMGSSTQRKLYLGEYRADWTDRDPNGQNRYVKGHERRVVRQSATGKLDVMHRPLGYNLACYVGGKYKSGSTSEFDYKNDLTHAGVERVDRSALRPNPDVFGISATSGSSRRTIGGVAWPGPDNVLADGPNPDSLPDITYWKGGEGNMNINALIRMLRILVNTRAAYAVAKHRPYRTQEQIIQAIEFEGATLTTVEYHRLMNNVTCHANYDPITGVSALNLNKLRFPPAMGDYLFSGPDPMLRCKDHASGGYDRETTNYLIPPPTNRDSYNPYKFIQTGWCYANEWDIWGWELSAGDTDPAVGAPYVSASNGVLAESRMLWASIGCIPTFVINYDKSDDRSTPMRPWGDPWLKMADYARREYELARDRSYRKSGRNIRNHTDFERHYLGSVLLRAVVSQLRNINNPSAHVAGIYGGESGMGEWAYGDVRHPSRHVGGHDYYSAGNAMPMGAALRNQYHIRNITEQLDWNFYANNNDAWVEYGWSPVTLGPQWELRPTSTMLWGPFVESIDRVEEVIAWMAPFHPVCNPHGRTVMTERQANDMLNNFIDFRDNIRDPNNLMTDWKLHSQEYDRGNYECYRQTALTPAKGINKDGYVNDNAGVDDRVNTVCSMLSGFDPSTQSFPDVVDGPSVPRPGIMAKVPYIYIKKPYFSLKMYRDGICENRSAPQELEDYYKNDKLFWLNKSRNRRGDSVIELDWNTNYTGGYTGRGYGDPEIADRLWHPVDTQYPWVNDLDHQDLNISAIGKINKPPYGSNAALIGDMYHGRANYIRNFNWATLNWTKDWLAFNYHKNMRHPTEFSENHAIMTAASPEIDFTNYAFGGANADVPAPSPVVYDYDTTHSGIAAGKLVVDADGGLAQDGSIKPYANYFYYESPGMIWGPDRINDAYQSLDNGHVLTDLSNYPSISDQFRFTEDNAIKLFTDLLDHPYDHDGNAGTPMVRDYIPDNAQGAEIRTTDFRTNLGASEIYPYMGFDRALNAFMWNCTFPYDGGTSASYGTGHSVSDGIGMVVATAHLDFNCKVITYFGYRGFDGAKRGYTHFGQTKKGPRHWLLGRFDFKNDSRYFHGTHTRAKEMGRNGWGRSETGYWAFAHVVTMYNKPYLWDVPQKSRFKTIDIYRNKITWDYSYNYGRNVYAYDFDGSACAIKDTYREWTGVKDYDTNTMYHKEYDTANKQVRYVKERYGERGCVAGAGGVYSVEGWPVRTGFDLDHSTFKARHMQTDIASGANVSTRAPGQLIPRFNCIEPYFDPMYPNGRLFYRRLMTAGDTTIVIGTYGNGPQMGNPDAIMNSSYNPLDYMTYNMDNILRTVSNCMVRNEDSESLNPFLIDGAGGGANGSTESWPCAGGTRDSGTVGSHRATHWNHVYNARYSVPYINDTTLRAQEQIGYACADAPWSVPFTMRDRYYEITVRADIVDTSLLEDFTDWRGVELLSSKKAVAIFDRGWRWAYWDDRINEASPFYDPYHMVGSRPGVDMAIDSRAAPPLLFDYGLYLKDNEMFTYDDWGVDTDGKYKYIRNRSGGDSVKVGLISPAEYCGQNRPGDDAPERARFVFFKWLGNVD